MSNLHNVWLRLSWPQASSGIFPVAHHNLHINTIFVYLFMQKLLVDKIHLFKFLCMSDKPRLRQPKIITSTRSTVQASLTAWIFPSVGERPSRKGKYTTLRTNTKPHQLIKHAKVSYSIVSLVFRKFSCGTYQNDLSRGTLKQRYSEYLKKYETC